ncbi:MAG: UDP-N-acetylmuramoyl-L-alanyl-D-glutamate--2,6-diaminopimelate ligase [Clostridia bacterium]|nr:UDP-N-acetylmuramoyl-L-alanyl-D-glutamate--2,6-diaminopimelate ligase [Clostridia bacterium]
MNLKEILVGLEGIKAKGNIDVEITNVDSDSRNIKENGLFIAIRGFEVDGSDYIEDAIANGASVVMVDENTKVKELNLPENVTLLMVPDTRIALAVCACNFYDNPSRKMKLIGVTGTKGKTTTTFMIKKILEKAGHKVGLIGTIAIYIGEKKIKDSTRTTPESIELQKIFANMVEENVDVVVMEVSSQSLKLNRVYGCDFDMGIFTNFSHEHISEKEHPDMEDYFNSKLKLFDMCKVGFFNADDIYAAKAGRMVKTPEVTTYGIDNFCHVLAKDITITNSYVDFKVKLENRNERVKTCIPGRFSVYNSLAAICVAKKMGVTPEQIKEALVEVRVPGRSELVDNKLGFTIMIDYAHTPESLESILRAVKSYTKGRVICVFGCGGDRDKIKRPLMGEVSGRVATNTIITSDNPRTEDPEEIVKEIEVGIKKTTGQYTCIVDRTEAIKAAIKMAGRNDIIVLAGKGHEPYQEINHETFPFDERIIVNEVIDELEEENAKKKKKK